MEITEVKIFPVSEEKLKAFVSIVIDGCFMVNDIKVIHGRDGLFISMPSRRKKNGEFKDVAHPLNNVTRRAIETRVLQEYDQVLAERGERGAVVGARPIPSETDSSKPSAKSSPAKAGRSRPGPSEEGAQPGKDPLAKDALVAEADPAGADQLSKGHAADGRTLKEVEELHLRDSFWSVP